jgi:hypothetical protein
MNQFQKIYSVVQNLTTNKSKIAKFSKWETDKSQCLQDLIEHYHIVGDSFNSLLPLFSLSFAKKLAQSIVTTVPLLSKGKQIYND